MSLMATPGQRDWQRQMEGRYGVNPQPQRSGLFGNMSGLFGGGTMAPDPQETAKAPSGPSGRQMTIGALGDMLASLGGRQPQFIPHFLQQRQAEQAQAMQVQQAKSERDGRLQDWMAQQRWQQANPEPVQPTEFDRALQGAGIAPGSPEAIQFYRDRASAMARDPADQFITATLPNGTFYAGPQTGLSTFMQGSAPARPQGSLRPMGGAGGNASGGF